VQSKDCTPPEGTLRAWDAAATWSDELPFVLLGLRAQHNTSTAQHNTSTAQHKLVFPWLRQFLVHKLSCQINFCQMMNFQLTPLSKKFPKPCMFLPLLCPGTILAPTCPACCQPSCSPSPSPGSVGAAWFHPFSSSTTSPTWSCAAAPAPSPSESGRGTRWSPSAALRLARPWTPRLVVRVAAADPLVSSPSSSLALPHDGPGTVFLPGEEVFTRPGPAAPSQPPQTQYPPHQHTPPKKLDL
jgi:hypothetical protein